MFHLRRQVRKPHDMKIRVLTTHLQRINDEDLPNLLPFKPENSMPEDEITQLAHGSKHRLPILLTLIPRQDEGEL